MSTFSFPERPVSEIINWLAETGIASLKPEDLAKPSADLVTAIYSNFLSFVDPLNEDSNSQIAFDALQFLENPDHHVDAIRIHNLYRQIKKMLSSIRFESFNLRDLIKPEPKRTMQILSTIVNFILYREEKLRMLQPIVDQFPAYEERRAELDAKIDELNQLILDHEVRRQTEESAVQQLNAEVKELRQTIQNYNKQQVSLKIMAKSIKEKTDAINEKISKADFELVKNAQENSKLSSKLVQSPDKLRRALEEKKSYLADLKNSQRLANQSVHEKTLTMEVYSKAYEKLAKHLSRMQALQEQVNSTKTLEKQVKALKAKRSDDEASIMALDAKIVEKQCKLKESEELIKVSEKERDDRCAEETQRLNQVRAEIEWKLQCLEPREKKVEAMVSEAATLRSEAEQVRQTGKAEQQEIFSKFEEIIQEFKNYLNVMDPMVERLKVVMQKESSGSTNTESTQKKPSC
ncbi:kinetochore protein NUF2 homolog [Zingiber officinale]|uniref:kinetochore protein NUF2 homolog n=1 Tax=Zingiber officinale TaxID=94328 RepID=UPI001C4D6055|nr:kinetochore protein NUF2 homolog [Zingiber officinale]